MRHHYTDPQLEQERLILGWRVAGLQHDDLDSDALDVLASLLANGRTSRLVRRLREELQWVRSISASHSHYRTQDIFSIHAKLSLPDRQRVEAAIWQEIEAIQKGEIQPQELERVCIQVANRFIFSNERSQERAQWYGYAQTLWGDATTLLHYPQRIRQVTLEAVQRVAQDYLTPQQTITLSFAKD
jgi:zinc protease